MFVGTAVCRGWWRAGDIRLEDAARRCCWPAPVLYVAGCFGVTIAANVPRNERLRAMSAESSRAHAYWPIYLRGVDVVEPRPNGGGAGGGGLRSDPSP